MRGSEAEKQSIRYKFQALRIWNGFSSLFFTLNPNDIKSPLTLAMVDKGQFHMKSFSLNMSDAQAEQFLQNPDNHADPPLGVGSWGLFTVIFFTKR